MDRLFAPSLVLLLLPLAGCLDDGGGSEVTIRWTDHGIPHITASNWNGLGLGYGYAFAEDNLCHMMEEIVTVNGQRSLYWGPEETFRLTSNGITYTNLQSDLFWTLFNSYEDMISSTGHADVDGLDEMIEGYAAGVNRYIDALSQAPSRHEECRDAPWLRHLSSEDVVKRFNKLQLLASSFAFAPGIVQAAPPPAGLVPTATDMDRPTTADAWAAIIDPDRIPRGEALGIGSNAYAFGADATPNGAGMLMGNPHFSWHGPERFHELHLTIPGVIDSMGMTIHGVPLILIGFNDDVAWSHTVSTGWRFTLHELTLVPGDPTSYIVDGAPEAMEPRQVTVETADGPVEHTFYMTRYGPVTELALAHAGPAPIGLDWTPTTAYAIQDANAHNDRITAQFLAFNQATSVSGIEAALETHHGIPWVNTIAADRHGDAFYADISVVPHITDAQIEACNVPLGQATTLLASLPILDGSRSACDWTLDDAAAQPGIIPAGSMPRVVRSDYVLNSNDSYWLPNPEEPLEGYPFMIGTEQSERSPRTRMGYVMHDDRLAGTADCSIDPEVSCDKMTLARLQDALFSARLFIPETEMESILATTCSLPSGMASDGSVVSFVAACATLSDWDTRGGNDSRGTALFERFWLKTPKTWTTPFDPEDPIHTPSGFMGLDPEAITAMADAIQELDRAGIAVDASGAEARSVERNGESMPIHGAHSELGSPSYITWDWDATEGFTEVTHGNSYIQTVTWDDEGAVEAEAILAYSQSTDPASPYYADQTRLYSQGGWVPLPFAADDVERASVRVMTLTQ